MESAGFAALRRVVASGRPCYLFGCGPAGQSWARTFAHLNFSGFLDNNPALQGLTFAGLSVQSPLEVAKRHPDALVLLASTRRGTCKAMRRQCRELGFECRLFVEFWTSGIVGPAGPADVEADVDLGHAYALMADDLSRETYRGLARFWGTREIRETPRVFPNQYFVEVVPTRFYRSFADVGAYDGDTLRQHIECLPLGFDNYYAIEPDPANLSHFNPAPDTVDNLHMFAVAASDRSGTLSWSSAERSSQAAERGEGEVPCDRLDSILAGRPVTFIKMDLEGHELHALEGARGIVAEQRPALAICVYHRYEHLWRVPVWIDSLVPGGYRFYLRHHLWGFMESVCYAVPVS
jgi:methyltransferase, FkbM family